MSLDFSEFTMPIKKKVEPAPRRIIVSKGNHLNDVQQELIHRGQIQPPSNNDAPGEKQCKRVPWTPPVINEIDESEYEDGIPADEWQAIQTDTKPKRTRKTKAKTSTSKTVAAKPRKKKRAPAEKVPVVCIKCNEVYEVYPSLVPPKGDVGSGYRCPDCLSRK